MANYFIASVGTAEAFKVVDNKPVMAFSSRTLTDSQMNVTTTKDDLRAGTGAAIVTSFTHDPNVEINLTDIMWKPEYLTAQLGAQFNLGGAAAYQNDTIVATADGLTLGKTAVAFPIASIGGGIYAWITVKGKEEWKVVAVADNKIAASDIEQGKTYCVRYLANEASAREAIITSNIIPEELVLVIQAPIFAGDANAASNGKKAGTITFEVPRFKLNGAQDFALNMSANTTMSLAGMAYADSDSCDLSEGKLVRIIEVIEGRSMFEGVTALELEGEDKVLVAQAAIGANLGKGIYAISANGVPSLVSGFSDGNKMLKFTATGTGAVGEYTGVVTTACVAGDSIKVEACDTFGTVVAGVKAATITIA